MKEIFKIEANTPLAVALLNNVAAQRQLFQQLQEMRFKIVEDIVANLYSSEEMKNFVVRLQEKFKLN